MAKQYPWMDELRSALELLKQGKPQECLDALDALSHRQQGDALCRALALDGMGRAAFALELPDKAVTALEESLALLQQATGETSPMTIGAMQNLAHALLGLDRTDESIALGQKAASLAEQTFGAQASQFADALLRLSAAFYRKRNFDEAESLMLRAKNIWESLGTCKPQLGVCLNNLGRICEERGQLDEGIALHRKALALRRAALGEHPDTAFSLGNLGVALASAGQWNEAAAALQDSLALYARLGQQDCAEAAGYRRNLEICMQAREKDRPSA